MKATDATDQTTITVHVPMTFTIRGGRKTIISDAVTAPPHPRIDNALLKALARAHAVGENHTPIGPNKYNSDGKSLNQIEGYRTLLCERGKAVLKLNRPLQMRQNYLHLMAIRFAKSFRGLGPVESDPTHDGVVNLHRGPENVKSSKLLAVVVPLDAL